MRLFVVEQIQFGLEGAKGHRLFVPPDIFRLIKRHYNRFLGEFFDF